MEFVKQRTPLMERVVTPAGALVTMGFIALWVLLILLGVVSWQRAWVYQSQETLWSDTLAKNPMAWEGRTNLGMFFLHKGQMELKF